MYAVIETGSKQYKVSEGDVIKVEKLNVTPGDSYSFSQVLMVVNGEKVSFGAPYLIGVNVTASVLGDGKHKKVIVYKYKPKKGFHKKKGHRQQYTMLKIDKIYDKA